ncbi:MAG: M23 family metallopeptidase [Gammaproteobacteria bacterium]|nr:M23 family metallopeptidase [Gammaproteobacteria bacterium]
MNIILVPGKSGSGRNSCLSHRHLMVIIFVGGVLLPFIIGFVALRIQSLVNRSAVAEDRITTFAAEITNQSRALEAAKQQASTHLNALALRMGQLQAQVLRLNALGGRLTRMAGLDDREFDFEGEVAQGGPERLTQAQGIDVSTSLDRLADEIRGSETRLRALDALLLHRRVTEAVTPTGWPVEGGFISSGFGERADPFSGNVAFHSGVDIASHFGSPIRAMADGVVSFSGETTGYGRVIELTHASGLVTRYAHTLSLLVKVGDKVTRGDAIALVGSSGRSTGPHVHFEVLKDGQAVNPMAYLQAAR